MALAVAVAASEGPKAAPLVPQARMILRRNAPALVGRDPHLKTRDLFLTCPVALSRCLLAIADYGESQTLLHVLKRESVNLTKKKQARRRGALCRGERWARGVAVPSAFKHMRRITWRGLCFALSTSASVSLEQNLVVRARFSLRAVICRVRTPRL